MDESRKIILEVDLDIAKSAKSISELKELQKQLNKELGNADIGSKEYQKLQVEAGLVDKEIKKLNADTKQINAEFGVQKGSLRDLQSQYNKLASALRETAPGNEVLGLSFEDAQKKALGLKEEIKDFEAKLGNFQSNVGNYPKTLQEASLQTGLFTTQTSQLAQAQQTLNATLGLVKTGFTTLRGAIIGTGIGALILLLASLVSYFTQTEAGGDRLAKVLSVLSAVFKVVSDILITVGEFIVEYFIGAFNDLFDVLSKVGNFMQEQFVGAIDNVGKALETVGLDEAGKSVRNFSKDVDDGINSIKDWASSIIEVGARIAELEDALEDLQVRNKIVNAQLQTQVEQNIKALKNRTLTYQESVGIINSALNAEKKILANNLEVINQEFKIAKEKFIQNANDKKKAEETFQKLLSGEIDAIQAIANLDGQNTTKTIDNIADIIVKREEANRQAILLETKLGNELDKLNEKRLADQQKALQDRLKKIQEAFDFEQVISDRRIAYFDYELKYFKLSADEQKNIALAKNKELLRIEELRLKATLSDTTLSSTKKATIDEQYAAKVMMINLQLKDQLKSIYEQEYANYQKTIDAKYNLDQSRLQRAVDNNNQLLSTGKLGYDQQIALIQNNADLQVQIEQDKTSKLLDNEQLLQDERTKIQEESTNKIANIYLDAEKRKQDALNKTLEIDTKNQLMRLQLQARVFGAASSLFDQQSLEYKFLASAQAVINTYSAATAALAPPPIGLGPVAGIPLAGVTVIEGLANVAKINGVKLEDGGIWGGKQGIIGGKRHSAGGTVFHGSDGSVFEAEQGELLTVVNRKDTARLMALSRENSVNGKPFFENGGVFNRNSYLSSGGIATQGIYNNTVSEISLANSITKALQENPPIVSVQDILSQSQKRQSVRVKSNLTKK